LKKFSFFIKPVNYLPCSQDPCTGTYPVPGATATQQHVLYILTSIEIRARPILRPSNQFLPAEFVGSNPTCSMDVDLLWVLRVVRYRSLQRTDYSPREVLPTLVRRWVLSRNLVNQEALTHWGPLRQIKKISSCPSYFSITSPY